MAEFDKVISVITRYILETKRVVNKFPSNFVSLVAGPLAAAKWGRGGKRLAKAGFYLR